MGKYLQNHPWLLFVFCGLFISLLLNIILGILLWRHDVVVRVVDGDSFDLADHRRVRLLGLDAPERGRCYADESRAALTRFIEGKHVTLRDVVTDDYGRMLANVYADGKLVNFDLVRNGFTRFESVGSSVSDQLKAASDQAKTEKLGIYSPACRQTEPMDDCTIKANTRAGKKTYFLPSCKNYTQVIVDQSFGDAWFCSEKEALGAGFAKSVACQ